MLGLRDSWKKAMHIFKINEWICLKGKIWNEDINKGLGVVVKRLENALVRHMKG